MIGPGNLQCLHSGGDALVHHVDGDEVLGESLVPVLVQSEATHQVDEAVAGDQVTVSLEPGGETGGEERPGGSLVHLH